MKRIFISISFILLSGCSMKAENAPKPSIIEYPTSTFISDEIRKNSELNELMRCTLSRDEKDLKKAATDIAIIKVISIDYSDMNFFDAAPTTYGKFLVDKTVHGTIKENNIYTYATEGGFIPINEYVQIRNPEFYNETTEEYRKKRENRYYNATFEPTMEIEAGKCYLALMKHYKDKDLYAFLDMGDGLREIDLPAQNKVKHESYDLNKLNVRNNVTGEMESLKSVIEKLK
ncbi:hypothetical protein [[Clostridium] innocuum]|uniref:hypothetical protein n=1 Tax=Clostridium innocuum TaxID=1522 RepID=UPI003A38955C